MLNRSKLAKKKEERANKNDKIFPGKVMLKSLINFSQDVQNCTNWMGKYNGFNEE